MESIYLKKFLENVGYAIHALNTICVGLNNIAAGDVEKPDDLVITWKPKDLKNSSLISRAFAIKSTYVFLAEATYEYMNYVKHTFISESNLEEYNELQNSEKVEKVFSVVSLENKYRLVMMKLLVHTRNRIVHNRSKADLSSRERDILKESKDIIYTNHSNLIVDDLLLHFDKNEFTLKDVSSHTANTIFMLREIDKLFIQKISSKKVIIDLINEYSVLDEWEKILTLEKSESKTKKIRHFLKLYFSFVDIEVLEQLSKEFA